MIKGIWFPWHFTEVGTNPTSRQNGIRNLWETKTLQIELNTVTDAQLRVAFPRQAEIYDTREGRDLRVAVEVSP